MPPDYTTVAMILVAMSGISVLLIRIAKTPTK